MEHRVKGPSLPNGINIIPPSSNLPKEIAVFSGKWAGTWEDGLSAIMVVEEIQDTWGQIVYAYGDLPLLGISAGHFRMKVEVTASPKPKIQYVSPIFNWGEPTSFEVRDSNTLGGNAKITWTTGVTGEIKVIMKRTN